MLTTQILSVDELAIGMYVAQLDRPWLETPFMFQGFYIRDADEIDELRSHCQHVYVSTETLPAGRPKPGAAAPRHLPDSDEQEPAKKRFSFRSLFNFRRKKAVQERPAQTNQLYETTTSLKDETRVASEVQKEAIISVKGVMEDLGKTGVLDVGSLKAAVTPMVDSVLRNPAALSCLMRMQRMDNYLYHHSIASSVWATVLGRQIGLRRDDLDVIALGAMLLDIGKIQVPIEILTKPGELKDQELTIVRQHVQLGLDILNKTGDIDARVLEMVAYHHERYNGTGYPSGLSGNKIPVFGRIAGIVDTYDAMITTRPYAEVMSSFDALRILRALADVEFQAEIIEQFIRAIGVFPTGTLVELNTGEVAIVTKQHEIRRLRPEVMLIMDSNKQLLDDFRAVNLNDEKVAIDSNESLWISSGLPPGSYGIDPTDFYLD